MIISYINRIIHDETCTFLVLMRIVASSLFIKYLTDRFNLLGFELICLIFLNTALSRLLKRWRLLMSPSLRLLQRRSCQRWFMTTMHLVQRTSGHWRRIEMHFPGFCTFLSMLSLVLSIQHYFTFYLVLYIFFYLLDKSLKDSFRWYLKKVVLLDNTF